MKTKNNEKWIFEVMNFSSRNALKIFHKGIQNKGGINKNMNWSQQVSSVNARLQMSFNFVVERFVLELYGAEVRVSENRFRATQFSDLNFKSTVSIELRKTAAQFYLPYVLYINFAAVRFWRA